MAKEMERQFVVNTNHPDWERLKASLPAQKYIQATIHRGDGNKLRVRLIEDLSTGKKTAAFTFKVQRKSGKEEPNIRDEYEWEVPYRVALYIMIGHKDVKKIRYEYRHIDGKVWEFDEYLEENEGIVLADIELKTRDESFDIPAWIGEETTKLKKITNNSFSLHPYKSWSEQEKDWFESLKVRK